MTLLNFLILVGIFPLARAGCVPSKGQRDSSIVQQGQSSGHQSNPLDFMQEYLRGANERFVHAWHNEQQCSANGRSIDDYQITAVLGRGGTSNVVLGKLRETESETYHAIKIMNKQNIIQQHLEQNVVYEKRVFQSLDFPFLVKMVSCFKDNTNLYLTMEYCGCGTLRHGFRENVVKFYSAQIVLALHYLHSMGFIYRDLKMENVLIGQDGYIRLADFGFATWQGENGRVRTRCGTLMHMAPEMIMEQSYGKSVDWWAFGITIYRMMTQTLPFGIDLTQDNLNTFDRKVINGRLEFDSNFSNDLQDLLRHLLDRSPGNRYGIREVVRHTWFADIDWEQLFHKQANVPYFPMCNPPGILHSNQNDIQQAIGQPQQRDRYYKQFKKF